MTDSTALSVDCSIHPSHLIQLPQSVDEPTVTDLVRFALMREGQSGIWTLSFAFVSEDEISRLHAQFLGDPTPTDIITFPNDQPGVLGGDVAICVPVAAEQGPMHGKSLEEELHFLALHGVLHLLGHSDETREMRAEMLARQEEIYRGWRTVSR